jgi:Holliday junction resolvasome RuvABC endonuclease subunit
MKILGLDTSTSSTGYAVVENNKILSYGTIVPNKKLDLLDRIIYIEKEIKEIIIKKQVEFIVIEDLAITRNAKTVKALSGLLYHLLAEFRKQEYLVIQARPSEWSTIYKFKGTKRKIQKQNAVNYIANNYKINVNEDEAEAILIALYGQTLEVEV